MTALTKFYCFTEDLADAKHNLGSDMLKIMLTNTAPSPTDTVLVDIVEIAAANGYNAGGNAAAVSSSAQTAGSYKLILDDVTFNASGGAIGPFRYVVLYNATHADKPLIAYADYGIDYTLPDGEPFVVDFDAAAGAIVLS